MASDQQYYVRRQGRVEGPWPFGKLQSEVKLKRLARYHEVSTDGQLWEPATSVAELFKKVETRKVLGGVSAPPVEDQKLESEDKWYCNYNGNQEGPVDKKQLEQLISSGQLRLDDLVWREGFPDWMPLEDVPELAPLYASGGQAAEPFGQTEATRLVELPKTEAKSTRLPLLAVLSGGGLFILSCIPFVGLFGVVPIAIGGYSAYQIRRTRKGDLWIAILGGMLGFAAFSIGVITLVAGGFYLFNSGS